MAISVLVVIENGIGCLTNYYDTSQDYDEVTVEIVSIFKTSKTLKTIPFAIVSNSVLIEQDIDLKTKKYNILMFSSFKKGKNETLCPNPVSLPITTMTRQLCFKIVNPNMEVQSDISAIMHVVLAFKCK